MANTITAGNGTNNGLAVTSDATGALNILTGSGGGTAAISIDSSQNVTMAANVTITGSVSASGGVTGSLKSATAQASTSGTSIDFTSIPNGVKRITVMLNGVSLSGTSNILIQIGSGSVTTSGYASGSTIAGAANSAAGLNSTAGFIVNIGSAAANIFSGAATINLISGTTWVSSYSGGLTNTNYGSNGGGVSPALSTTLDRVRITTVNGTDTFDAGSINIIYE